MGSVNSPSTIREAKRINIATMTDTVPDSFDDLSFYVGDDADGFNASLSVCDSDISETDSESSDFVDFDHGEWLAETPSASHCGSARPTVTAGLTPAKSEHKLTHDISCLTFKNGNDNARDDVRGDTRNAEWGIISGGPGSDARLNTSTCRRLATSCDLLNKRCDASAKTVSTGASSSEEREDEDYKKFLLYLKDRGPTEDVYSLCSSRKEEPTRGNQCTSNPAVCTVPSPINPIDTILENNLYCSALLLALAHDPKKRNSRFCGTHLASEEAMPVM